MGFKIILSCDGVTATAFFSGGGVLTFCVWCVSRRVCTIHLVMHFFYFSIHPVHSSKLLVLTNPNF